MQVAIVQDEQPLGDFAYGNACLRSVGHERGCLSVMILLRCRQVSAGFCVTKVREGAASTRDTSVSALGIETISLAQGSYRPGDLCVRQQPLNIEGDP